MAARTASEPSQQTSTTSPEGTVVTVAASLLVLAEPVTPLTLAAVALILCGLALSQYRGKKSKEPA